MQEALWGSRQPPLTTVANDISALVNQPATILRLAMLQTAITCSAIVTAGISSSTNTLPTSQVFHGAMAGLPALLEKNNAVMWQL
jgi:hypothetical protein